MDDAEAACSMLSQRAELCVPLQQCLSARSLPSRIPLVSRSALLNSLRIVLVRRFRDWLLKRLGRLRGRRKPNSVLRRPEGAAERQSSIYDAGCPAPLAAYPEVDRRAACGEPGHEFPATTPPVWPCSRWGLPRPAGHPAAGELLPRHFTLAGSRSRDRMPVVCFCGTVLGVAPTGR